MEQAKVIATPYFDNLVNAGNWQIHLDLFAFSLNEFSRDAETSVAPLSHLEYQLEWAPARAI